MLTFIAYSGLINTLTSIALGIFILVINFRSLLGQRFAFFCFSVAFWAAFYFLWLTAEGQSQAFLWIRLAMTGVIFIPFSFTLFVHCFLGIKNRWIDTLNFLNCILYLSVAFSPWFIQGIEMRNIFPYWPIPGIFFHGMVAYFFLNTAYAHWALWRSLKTAKGLKRDQIRYVALGTLVGFIGGSTNYFLWYNIPIPPVLNGLVSLYIVSVAYAIARFKLMNIEVIIRKTVVFAGLFTFIYAVFAAATFLVNEFLSRYFGVSSKIAMPIVITILMLSYDTLRMYLVHWTDKYLFQKKYDYQKILKDASRGMSKIESLNHLIGLVVHFITMKIRTQNAAVFMRKNKEGDFWLGYQRGYSRNLIDSRLDHSHPLIQYVIQEKEGVEIESIKHRVETGGKALRNSQSVGYDFKAMVEAMEGYQAVCCIPSFLGHELQNILFLGEKKSGDAYTDADLNVLYTLAQESAIAIENARLFDEANQKTHELKIINEQLQYSKNKLMKALQETEVANKQLLDTQAQLIHEQKMATLGRLAASVGHEVNNPLTILSMNVSRAILKYRKDPELKVAEVLDLFQKMEQNIGRIKAVVNTLTGLLKKSEKGKFEPLSLKLILEETLPLVQFQTYLDNLSGTEVEFDIAGSTPLIRGDLERLQEVFLNLFINAYHAMSGRRNRKIKVSAKVDLENAEFVAIHFTDNGSGMPEEIQRKIFNYGFTTKPPGKGSGMGLYMCKYIIELHGGSIRVKSTPGIGSTFTLTLPIHIETSIEKKSIRKEA